MIRKNRFITAVLFVLAAVLLAACASGAPQQASSSAPMVPSIPPAGDISEPAGALAVPDSQWVWDISTTTLDGNAFTGEELKDNTLTVLNVWATWCGPCVAELPHLQQVSQKFTDEGVEVIGLLQDAVDLKGKVIPETVEQGELLLADAGADYRVIVPDAVLMENLLRDVQYFPTTYFLNSKGEVVSTVVGANTADSWEGIINEVLEKIS